MLTSFIETESKYKTIRYKQIRRSSEFCNTVFVPLVWFCPLQVEAYSALCGLQWAFHMDKPGTKTQGVSTRSDLKLIRNLKLTSSTRYNKFDFVLCASRPFYWSVLAMEVCPLCLSVTVTEESLLHLSVLLIEVWPLYLSILVMGLWSWCLSTTVIKAWPVFQSNLRLSAPVKNMWPLCMSVPVKSVWPLCLSDPLRRCGLCSCQKHWKLACVPVKVQQVQHFRLQYGLCECFSKGGVVSIPVRLSEEGMPSVIVSPSVGSVASVGVNPIDICACQTIFSKPLFFWLNPAVEIDSQF